MLRLVISVFLFNSIQCANILGVFMYPSMDHQIIFQQIWRELSLRGHQVTVLTPNPLNNPKLTNLTEISLSFAYDVLEENKEEQTYYKDLDPYTYTKNFNNLLDKIAEEELNSTQFKTLVSDQTKKFDLILIEFIHPVMYALSHRFEAPIIAISSMSVSNDKYDAVGNPNHPILYPDPILNLRPGISSMTEKIHSILFFLFCKYQHHMVFVPRAHEMAKRHFGDDVPYIGDLERNVSMFFINLNIILHAPRANVPAIVEMGPLNTKPPRRLPNNLQKILDDAKEGVIYVNLGSNMKIRRFGNRLQNNIIDALSELPYKILLKWEGGDLPRQPSNIILRKSLPQRDILAHPNVKLFVTQGDQQSLEESIAGEVPIVGIPFVDYQPGYVQRVVDIGIAEKIEPDTLTKIQLKNVINKVINTPQYKETIHEIRDIMFDKPMTGMESVVWWSEYVIRHNGARHLRSAAVDMPWYQYLLVDVVSFLIAAFLTCLYIGWKLLVFIKRFLQRLVQKTDKKEKQN